MYLVVILSNKLDLNQETRFTILFRFLNLAVCNTPLPSKWSYVVYENVSFSSDQIPTIISFKLVTLCRAANVCIGGSTNQRPVPMLLNFLLP